MVMFYTRTGQAGQDLVGKNRPYILVPYRKEWKEIFEEVRKILLEEIFNEQIVEVHHFGSTSIPNIKLAKPQIDVIAVCKSLETVRSEYCDVLEILLGVKVQSDGYTPTLNEVYCAKDSDFSGMRELSLHIMQEGDPEIQKPLIFKKYLIANPDVLRRYVVLKNNLRRLHPNSYQDYDREKGEVIKKDLLPQALAWYETWHKTSTIIKTLSPRF